MKTLKRFNTVTLCIAAGIIFFPMLCLAGQKAQQDNQATLENIKQETADAVRAIKNYSIKQKGKAVKDVERLLENTDDRLDLVQKKLDKKWDKMDQASREKARETLTALRKTRNRLSEWYGELKNSSANAWDQTKKGFVESYESLSRAVDRVESEFSAAGEDK